MARLTPWPEIRSCEEFQGRWVAMCDCVYDNEMKPVAGQVVDADDDLVTLCNRMQQEGSRRCAILFCEPVTH